MVMRLPEAILVTSNQNRYCSWNLPLLQWSGLWVALFGSYDQNQWHDWHHQWTSLHRQEYQGCQWYTWSPWYPWYHWHNLYYNFPISLCLYQHLYFSADFKFKHLCGLHMTQGFYNELVEPDWSTNKKVFSFLTFLPYVCSYHFVQTSICLSKSYNLYTSHSLRARKRLPKQPICK